MRYFVRPESLFGRLSQTDFMNRAMLFAALLLLIMIPFMIVVSASVGRSFSAALTRSMGLDSRAADVVASVFGNGASSSGTSTGSLSVLTVVGVFAVVSALQGLYEDIFGLAHKGLRGFWRWVVWAAALMGFAAGISEVGGLLENSVGLGVVSFILLTAFFWWTLHFLLARRIAWRQLLPSAVATAVFWIGLGVFSSIFFSSAIVSNYHRFGAIGVLLLLMSWLIAVGVVIILGAVVGILWQERGYTLVGLLPLVRHRKDGPASGARQAGGTDSPRVPD